MAGYVYIVTDRPQGTLYIGVTSNLVERIFQHRSGTGSRFTSRYRLDRLVWYEEHLDIGTAIQREKSLKRWYRGWKIDLIEQLNPDWQDLYPRL